SRLRLELCDVRLARLVRAGTRRRHFRRNVEQRGDIGVDAGEGVERPRDELGLEVQLGIHATDEAGRRLEAERRPRERALLLLEQAGEVDGPALPQVVARGERYSESLRSTGARRAVSANGVRCGNTAK